MAEAEGKSAELLEIVQKKLGKKPNMMRTMAHSPAVLEAYLNFSGALNGASIPLKTREMIALLCARKNSCDYCLAAHTAIGAKVGLSEVEIEESLIGRSADQKTAAILKLVNTILDTNGSISDADFAAAKSAGLSDAELVEIPAIVGLNVFTNYFNHIIDPEIDFPKPKQSSCGCSSC
jgi:uncharacterized peroxidase-related enzyme